MTPTAGEATTDEAFRCADVELLDGGDGLILVTSAATRASGYYRPEQVDVLQACRTFASLDQHVAALLFERHDMPAPLVEKQLRQFLRDGLMLIRSELFPPSRAEPRDRVPLSTLGVPTIGRVDALRRCLDGYSANALRHGHSLRYVVVDDSKDDHTRNQCRAAARSIAAARHLELRYAGADEKVAYVQRLVAGGVPADLARFALLGPADGNQPTIGANRNCLLLATVGETLLSVDDDTVCVTARPPGYRADITLNTADSPLELWPFPRRSDTFTAAANVEIDLINAHAALLGRAPRDVLASADREGLAAIDDADPHLLRRALDSATIRVTAAGVAGDCGWDSSDFLLFQTAASRERLDAAFETREVGRDMIQAAQSTVLTPVADPKFRHVHGLGQHNTPAPVPSCRPRRGSGLRRRDGGLLSPRVGSSSAVPNSPRPPGSSVRGTQPLRVRLRGMATDVRRAILPPDVPLAAPAPRPVGTPSPRPRRAPAPRIRRPRRGSHPAGPRRSRPDTPGRPRLAPVVPTESSTAAWQAPPFSRWGT